MLVLSCASWGVNAKSSGKVTAFCDALLRAYAAHLESLGLSVETRCGSLIDDYLTMMASPALISMGSSMSFSAAMASEGMFLQLCCGSESLDGKWSLDGVDMRPANPDEFMHLCPIRPVLHSTVPDYFAKDAVENMLGRGA